MDDKNKFWVTIFNGESWLSYAVVDSMAEARKVLDNLRDDEHIWQTRISVIVF